MNFLNDKAIKFQEEHPYIEPSLAYQHGYIDGYADVSNIKRIPSDGMIVRILTLSSLFDRTNNKPYTLNDKVEYIKSFLYEE